MPAVRKAVQMSFGTPPSNTDRPAPRLAVGQIIGSGARGRGEADPTRVLDFGGFRVHSMEHPLGRSTGIRSILEGLCPVTVIRGRGAAPA